MSIIQAALIASIYYLGNATWLLGVGYYTAYRPLVAGFLVGLILGDPVTGTLVGASINLMYLGFISAGGALPGDPCLAGVVGTSLAISGGLATEAAVATAVPLGLLGGIIWVGKMTINTTFVRLSEKIAAKGDANKIWISVYGLPQLLLFAMSWVPAFIMVYYGGQYIQGILNFIGANVLGILGTIGGMMPALGIALTLQSVYKGESKIFFYLGFLLIQFFGLNMISMGFLSLAVTIIYMQLRKEDEVYEDESHESEIDDEHSRYALLDKATVKKSWFNWMMFSHSCYNYERMQGQGVLQAMVPIVNKLYPNDREKRAETLLNEMKFFNTEPNVGACIIGLAVSLEEKKAQGAEEITNDTITSIKSSLMGPLAGIGDTITQGVITPILISMGVSIALDGGGNIAGPIVYIISIATAIIGISYISFKLGYEKGSDAILEILESGKINKVILGASIMGCMVLGALVGNYVKISTSILIPMGTGAEPLSLQTGFFDRILPGLLPLLLTLLNLKMLEKGWSSVKVLLAIIAIGAIGGILGILA